MLPWVLRQSSASYLLGSQLRQSSSLGSSSRQAPQAVRGLGALPATTTSSDHGAAAVAAGAALALASPFSATSSSRRQRLQRELRELGLDPQVLLDPGDPLAELVRPAWPVAEAFLDPRSDEELAVASIPGRARTVACRLAEALAKARAEAAAELCNSDRTEQELQAKPRIQRAPLTVVLSHGLTPEEVGCLLRTCESAGVQEVQICGDTPGPPDPKVLKTSLKAEDFVPHRRAPSIVEQLPLLRAAGCQIWGITDGSEESSAGADVVGSPITVDPLNGEAAFAFARAWPPSQPLALIIGPGSCGSLEPEVARNCDVLVRLGGACNPASVAEGLDIDLSGPGPALAASVVIYDLVRRLALLK
ncbi:unnamed protein product [Polarella glacialis]|uniref:tRNA/rRNA methyltransferase SpoU type domain-containing protein n=1 Tax=Polarella glacialis TaxID=89957 RepID=A0A813HA75_POLGL|nr:unnamed protein product [Polarella glacialis]